MTLSYSRLIGSLAMIVFVGAVVVSATGAFFSDTETSTGNRFTAGAIDLLIDNSSYGFDWNRPGVVNPTGVWGPNEANSWTLDNLAQRIFFNFIDLKPGDFGEDTISIHVQNDAWACMAMDLTGTPDNGINEPEAVAGDVTDGEGGELQNYLNFAFWNDDGDNVYEDNEGPLLFQGLASALDGAWQVIADSSSGSPLTANTIENPEYIGKFWCFGELTATPVAPSDYGAPTATITGFQCNGAGNHNVAQTDGIVVDVHFHAVQSRNNGQFLCSSLPPVSDTGPVGPTTLEVTAADLYVPEEPDDENRPAAFASGDWFFYNDTNDKVMILDQFSPDGANNIVAGPDLVGAARMLLDDVLSRYNIATYKYQNLKLADITNLSYRIYDASASSETPYLHFNIDFNNSDAWQGRLVQVPSGVAANTWTEVDALAGMWTKTSGNWPAGATSDGSITGGTPRTWAEIIADYPNAETRSTDSFFGIRVGHPGPDAEESFVDWIRVNDEITDFEI